MGAGCPSGCYLVLADSEAASVTAAASTFRHSRSEQSSMNLKCLAYRVLDASRRLALVRWAFYHGVPIVIRPNVKATATVRSVGESESDGDVTFHVDIDDPDERGSYRHCELTPCDPDDVRATVKTLKVGDRIAIVGDERFDPHHVLDNGGPDGSPTHTPGWWEFHGLHAITVLKGQSV